MSRARRAIALMAGVVPLTAVVSAAAPVGAQAPAPGRVGVGGPPVTAVTAATAPPGGGAVPVGGDTTTTGVSAPTVTSTTAPTITSTTVPAPTITSTTAPTIASTTVPLPTVSTTAAPPTSGPPAASTTTAGPVPGGSTTTTVAPPRTPAEVRTLVSQALRSSGASSVGAMALIDGVGSVYEVNAVALLPPASIMKLMTGGAALLELGPDHRFVTTVQALGPLGRDGVLRGDLAVVVSGDPSLATSDLFRMADAVAGAGVRTIEGAVVVDDLRVDRATQLEGWKPTFVPGEVGYLTGFVVDGNHRYDALSRTDASLANLVRFADRLKAKGVSILGGQRRALRPTEGGTVLASHRSPPLAELVTHMMKKSENTYAELILRELGARSGNPTTAGGAAAVGAVADRFGVPRPVQLDGSGLSSANRITASGMVRWLRELDVTPAGQVLRASLPIACVDGTMRGRLCRTPADGRALAKTGSLDYTVTLAGFTTTATGRRVTYAFLLSGLASSSRGRAAVDRAVAALSAYAA